MKSNLYYLNESLNNAFPAYLIDTHLYAAIICGVFVIVSKNPIVSVLFLIALFLNISSYILLTGMYFIAISYLLVYVGAVSILFLFILMLINIRISELNLDSSNGLPLSILVGIYCGVPLYGLLPYTYIYIFEGAKISLFNFNGIKKFLNLDEKEMVTIDDISIVSSKVWDGNLAENTHITTIGNVMYSSYSMWLIITSLILLLAMVGAIIITIKQEKKRN